MLTTKHLIGLLVSLVACASVQAGWITMTNDTDCVVVIQETTGPLNKPVRGKSIKLQPGETYKEFQLLGGRRSVLITAPKNVLLRSTLATLTWGTNDTSIQLVTHGQTMKFEPTGVEQKPQMTKSVSSK